MVRNNDNNGIGKNRIHDDLHEGSFKFRISTNNGIQLILYDFGHVSTSNIAELDQIRRAYYPTTILQNPTEFDIVIKSVARIGNVDDFITDLETSAKEYIEFHEAPISQNSCTQKDFERFIKRNIEGLDYGFTNIFNLLRKHCVRLPIHYLIIPPNYNNLISILNIQEDTLVFSNLRCYIDGLVNAFTKNSNSCRHICTDSV